jgi:NAD(P)-dependent dehydrogenase (short-subunit alcohol dehydrogenase family)
LDTRPINSWSLKLDQVSTIELLEVQLVNAIAPFLLNSKLKPLMLRSRFERRFIINVSAMEGQFNRESKTPFHPHTNMAKAALNMMTRTSASDYAEDNIFMNSVDTGWITDENPYPKKMHLQYERGFYPPLDIIDGMARLYDPIVQGLKQVETPQFGYFLKDYFPHPW